MKRRLPRGQRGGAEREDPEGWSRKERAKGRESKGGTGRVEQEGETKGRESKGGTGRVEQERESQRGDGKEGWEERGGKERFVRKGGVKSVNL